MLKMRLKNRSRAQLLKLILLTTITFSLASTVFANAKSFYAIDDINGNPTPIISYDIGLGGTLTYQAINTVTRYGGGAVGIAVDSDSAILFVTYEVSNTIKLLDATTMGDLGITTAPGASDLQE